VIERFTFGVDESSVAMALLVQPYATNIVANGVALSKIPFRLDFPGTYICSNHLDFKVTDDDGTAETLAVYDEHDGTVEVVSRSSRLDGAPVLHEKRRAAHSHVREAAGARDGGRLGRSRRRIHRARRSENTRTTSCCCCNADHVCSARIERQQV
jgi:hypothetical protein